MIKILKTSIKYNNYFYKFFLESICNKSLTFMINNEINVPKNCCGKGLRYLRDRISVPRDMPLLSARKLRQSLEKIASFDKSNETYSIPFNHRYDQNPKDFS